MKRAVTAEKLVTIKKILFTPEHLASCRGPVFVFEHAFGELHLVLMLRRMMITSSVPETLKDSVSRSE
jgi:hypothetical protein